MFKIIYYLLNKGKSTATELASECEVSVRTIYRDIDNLSSIGIPVYSQKGKGGGIFLMEEFTIDKSIISRNEQINILSALENFSSVLPNEQKILLEKLRIFFKQESKDWIEVNFSRWGNSKIDNDKFNIIRDSILNKNIISIKYINSYSKESTRMIKPAKINFKSNNWYIQAYCMDKNDYRVFKINRIIEMKVLDEKFDDDLIPPEIDQFGESCSEKTLKSYEDIQLKFKKKSAYRVFDEFNNKDVMLLENGDMIVNTIMPIDYWLVGYLMSFCGDVEIVKPQHLKKKFVDVLMNMEKEYIK